MSLGKAGPFELLELLGEGGVGQVFSARDSILGRQVAIKMLRRELSSDREFLDRFYGEAQRLGDLNHANITTLYGLYFEGDKPFMAMELVRGHTLKDLVGRAQRLPPRESLAVIAQTLAGLAYAHRALVIHRDIKPSNLMVTDGGVVKIMDFGIARVRGSTHMTRAGQAFLTPLYASPEQIKGEEADERSDLYSLGVVFYEMLAGRPPFTAKSEYLLERAHLEEPPPPLAAQVRGLDPRVEAAVMQALAKNPEDRFAGAEQFGQAIGARAIRGDAPDILQEFIAASRRETAPDETRRISRASGVHAQPSLAPRLPDSAARQAEARPLAEARARPQPRRKIPVPATVLGGVAVVLVIGGGYAGIRPALEWLSVPGRSAAEKPPSRPNLQPGGSHRAPDHPPHRTARSERFPPAPPPQSPAPHLQEHPAGGSQTAAARPVPPQSPAPRPNEKPAGNPQTAAAEPSNAHRPAGAVSLTRSGPVALIAPPPQSPLPSAKNGPATNARIAPLEEPNAVSPPIGPAPVPSPPMVAHSRPDLEGIVKGAMSASMIKIGNRWIELYGIDDPDRKFQPHIKAVFGYLTPAQGRVACYRKTPRKYQCYAGGQDLALLALRDGIARLAPDAPAQYREGALRRPLPRKQP